MNLNKKFLLGMIAVIGIYSIFIFLSDIEKIDNKIQNFHFEYLPLILVIIPSGWFILYLRWEFLLKHNSINLPHKDNFLIYFAGFSLGVTPGKSGELIKSILLKNKFKVPISSSAPIILVERFYDLIGAVMASFLGIMFIGNESLIIIILSTLVLIIAIRVISSKKFFDLFLNLLSRFNFLKKLTAILNDSYPIIRDSSKGKIFLLSSSLTMIFWIIESIGVYLVLLGFDIHVIDYLHLIAIYTSSLILGAASMIPGGIGVAESSLAGQLVINGVDISLGFVAVIVIRFVTLWYGVLIGFFALKFAGTLSTEQTND